MIQAADGGALALVGDIGGTNARFAIADLTGPAPVLWGTQAYRGADFERPLDAIETYLATVEAGPSIAVLAVAGPVDDGAARLTNARWRLSEAELTAWGFGRARLVNDFAAQAWALPLLGPGDAAPLGGGVGEPEATLAVLGPGTGFGVAAWVRDGEGREAVLAGEGGHMAFAPADETEIEVMRRLAARHGRCSVERILSGPGLLELHRILADLAGEASALDRPEQVTTTAQAGDPAAMRTLERFCAILGAVAGDVALACGARGGVYIAGGIAPTMLEFLERSAFRARFEAKGRFAGYLREIPTRVVTREHPALLGAANVARRLREAGPGEAP